MNRATLAELQRQRRYPSISVLANTTAGVALTPSELEHSAAVRLALAVDERATVDDTFTTRDLVADLNRTATYRVITISEQCSRLFLGDRRRLVEQRDDVWPLVRRGDHTPTTWASDIDRHLAHEHITSPLPTVLAGVQRSIRKLAPNRTDTIGVVAGNHDRTSASDLHDATWPIVTDWLRTDTKRAIEHLDAALSGNRYAGGIHEVWPLAHDGRVAILVVETDYVVPARVDSNNQLNPADDPHHPDVNDDIVDDAIETVLLHGGSAIIVNSGTLAEHQHIAAVLRY